jgi:hypothetical protein
MTPNTKGRKRRPSRVRRFSFEKPTRVAGQSIGRHTQFPVASPGVGLAP